MLNSLIGEVAQTITEMFSGDLKQVILYKKFS